MRLSVASVEMTILGLVKKEKSRRLVEASGLCGDRGGLFVRDVAAGEADETEYAGAEEGKGHWLRHGAGVGD